jgi:hypothetical protein
MFIEQLFFHEFIITNSYWPFGEWVKICSFWLIRLAYFKLDDILQRNLDVVSHQASIDFIPCLGKLVAFQELLID